MAQQPESAEFSAMTKLEQFYGQLSEAEKPVISDLVRHALLQAAAEYEGDTSPDLAESVPAFVNGLGPTTAPSLIRSLQLPGRLVAYSPGCASHNLLDLKTSRKNQA
ncbi:MAG TPA: hypothetical protein VKU38_01070 [Ktedonobacteraceae bacterium]|nr:hypothetical protein [Ktedonobacteraceae bacterium]